MTEIDRQPTPNLPRDALRTIARHGRLVMVIGLILGVAIPGLSAALRPWLPHLVALMLFVTAFRIGPRAALGSWRDLGGSVGLALIFQVAMPLAGLAVFTALGVELTPLALVLMLVLAGSTVTGAPNFTIMLGHDPAPALRMLMVGTALLPLTVLPVLWAMPQLGGAPAVLGAALRLLAVIGVSVALAFVLRSRFRPVMSDDDRAVLDGGATIGLALIGVALMAALGPALRSDLSSVVFWMIAAFAANYGLQIVTRLGLLAAGKPAIATPIAVVAGNRNLALFLVALPAAVTDPILLFIGCYQVPMYLGPILLARFHGKP